MLPGASDNSSIGIYGRPPSADVGPDPEVIAISFRLG